MSDALLYIEKQSIFDEIETKSTSDNNYPLNDYQEYYYYSSNNNNYEDISLFNENNFNRDEIAITMDETFKSKEKLSYLFDESYSIDYKSINSLFNDNNSNKFFNNIINLNQTIISNEINTLNISTLNEKISNLEEYIDELTNKLVYYKIKEDYTLILEKELEVMNKKLNYAIPIHAITYMCVNMFILGASLILLYLRFGAKIYTIDPYYLICAVIISLGLFLTAFASLKDWKEFLINNEQKR